MQEAEAVEHELHAVRAAVVEAERQLDVQEREHQAPASGEGQGQLVKVHLLSRHLGPSCIDWA